MVENKARAEETLFMTILNFSPLRPKTRRYMAYNERSGLHASKDARLVVVSRGTKPDDRVFLWIVVIGQEMTISEIKQSLSALGWIMREITSEILYKEGNETNQF